MQQVVSDQMNDFAAIFGADIELVIVKPPSLALITSVAERLMTTRQVPQSRWVQPVDDLSAAQRALPESVDEDVRGVLVEQIGAATQVLSDLFDCHEVGIRLETLSAPMCPRFHVDYIPCRMLITLGGAGTEWIANPDVDWQRFAELGTTEPPLQDGCQVRQMSSGDWSLLKGGAWSRGFQGVVHRSPHVDSDRVLLSLDPILN
ncbi:MAG: DUF1826 domain-containing protein [Pseudomonadota bacterium]